MNDDTPRPASTTDPADENRRAASPRLTLVSTKAAVHAPGALHTPDDSLARIPLVDIRPVARPAVSAVKLDLPFSAAAAPALNEITRLAPSTFSSAHTFGFATQAGMATHSGSKWISPLLRHSVEFPSVWIQKNADTRYAPSRARVTKLLDRLCGADPGAPPPRTLVVVAHPDDEAIGAGARLRAIPDTTIVHVTDGAPRDPEYARRKGFPSREAYARSRQDELTAALAILGIPRERTRCLDVIDGEATERLVEITYRLAAIFDELRPEVAVTHPYEGGHTDHDATAFAVHLACGVLRREGAVAPIILELTSYHLYRGARRVGEFLSTTGAEERTIDLDPDVQGLKQRMYDCFASQRECLAMFPRDREKFRMAPRYVFTRAPHEGPLLYERVSDRFEGERWRESAERALQRLRSKQRAAYRA